jgi:hypothetical protein
MAKAYLQDTPLGNYSLRSIVRNAGQVSYFLSDWHTYLNRIESNPKSPINFDTDHIFYQRTKLLSVMVKSIAQGNPLGLHRKAALKSNVEYISEILPYLRPFHKTALSVVK